MNPAGSVRFRAIGALVAACVFWGVGFPISKGLMLGALHVDPGVSSWFLAAYLIGFRFLLAAMLLLLVDPIRPNWRELAQGVALGVITGVGMLFQLDGLVYTEASTNAFLTQGYIVLLPVAATVANRRAPPARIVACSLLVLVGLAILARFDPRAMSLGRGEAETLFAATCFTFQILLLDARRFAQNRTRPVSVVMFTTMGAVTLPAVVAASRSIDDLRIPLSAPMSWCYFLTLIALPTMGSFLLMNRYQRLVSASEAGIIYATEPVFASVFALVLPAAISRISGISYANETVDTRMVTGGALVVLANMLLVLFQPSPDELPALGATDGPS
jgi:drug/metabolite transporter (DMT)-like permease